MNQLLIAADTQTAVIWDIPHPEQRAPALGQGQVNSIAFSPDPDARWAITGSLNSTARLRDTATGQVTGWELKHAAGINRVAFRPDGEVVLTASSDGTAKLWNTADGRQRGQTLNHRNSMRPIRVTAAVFSDDGR